jgi:hypothetical protein
MMTNGYPLGGHGAHGCLILRLVFFSQLLPINTYIYFCTAACFPRFLFLTSHVEPNHVVSTRKSMVEDQLYAWGGEPLPSSTQSEWCRYSQHGRERE